ncbi:hypothetical protein OG873_07275 [Streptomyces violaceus]|uniref:hypothetical protein n=1 Tax=Streptomyces violaceus TaxID=1936 RepID=UPI002E2DA71D|nr:hypothetical protein [Streptomyces violaceus]
MDKAEQRRQAVEEIWQQRLERADYAVERARRQYQPAEPENRLVVRELERGWEAALRQPQQLGEEYDRFLAARPRPLTPEERKQITALARDLPAIWPAQTTTDADRKQLLRHLIERVEVTVVGTSERLTVQIAWAGGHHSHGEVIRPVGRLDQLSYFPQPAARARARAGHTAAAIAKILNAEGFRPPKRRDHFGPQAVRQLLQELGCVSRQEPRRVVAHRHRPRTRHAPHHPPRLDQERLGHRPPTRRRAPLLDHPRRRGRGRTAPPAAPVAAWARRPARLAVPPAPGTHDSKPQV